MKLFFSVAFLSFFSVAAMAQNWSPINTQETFYYNSDGEELTGIRVDSVAVVEGDTVWYTNRYVDLSPQLDSTQFACPEFATSEGIIQAGFLQGEMVFIENGGVLFQQPDTFLIFPAAGLGEEWLFRALTGQQPVTAEVVNLVELEVLGEVDSVKTIALSDGRTIQLSKNHGLLAFESSEDENYTLSGIPERQLGNYPIGRYEIFDFEVGDVFVYIENYALTSDEVYLILRRFEITSISQDGNNLFEYTYNAAVHHRIWELTEVGPGVYMYVEAEPMIGQGEGSTEIDLTTPHFDDAIAGTYYSPTEPLNEIEWPPSIYWQDGSFGHHKHVYSDAINTRESKVIGGSWAFSPALIAAAEDFGEVEVGGWAFDSNGMFHQFDVYPFNDGPSKDIGDTTVLVYSSVECAEVTVTAAYANGLGVVSYGFLNGLNHSMTAMVGYRKGDEEFGYIPTASEILSVGDELAGALPSVSVYPVPTADELFLTSHQAESFRIFDISGKPVLHGALKGASAIDVSTLAAGIYNGHLLRNEQPTGQFRFVKQ